MPPRSSKQRVTYQQTRSNGGAGSTIVFLAIVFGMAWWFTKTDDFDLFVFIRQAIESAIDQYQPDQQAPAPQATQPRPAPPAVTTPAAATPATPATAAGRRSKDSVPAAGDKGTTPALTYRGTMPPDIEGLTQAQVEQRLGAPTRRLNGGEGVTMWVYQSQNSATLIVYFYRDRASLKAPR